MQMNGYIVSIVKRLVMTNYKCLQNLKKQQYFNEITPCIY